MADINTRWPWPADRQGQLGTYADEVHPLRQLERDPDASPTPEVTPRRLLDPERSSDDLRLGRPSPVSNDPYEAEQLARSHVVFRRLLSRRRRTGWSTFERAVEEENLPDIPNARRKQMRASLRRESAMLDLIRQYHGLAEEVYARLLSESKG